MSEQAAWGRFIGFSVTLWFSRWLSNVLHTQMQGMGETLFYLRMRCDSYITYTVWAVADYQYTCFALFLNLFFSSFPWKVFFCVAFIITICIGSIFRYCYCATCDVNGRFGILMPYFIVHDLWIRLRNDQHFQQMVWRHPLVFRTSVLRTTVQTGRNAPNMHI